MKLVLIVILVFISSFVYSQIGFGRKFCGSIGEIDSTRYFYIYEQDTIDGTIPKDNRFSGEIAQYKKYYHKMKNSVVEGKDGLQYQYGIFSELLFAGEYKNGKKVGTWYYTKPILIDIDGYKVEYKKDTVIVSPRYDPFKKKKIVYVSDSNYVYGYTMTKLKRKIEFRCYKRKKCHYYIDEIEKPIFELEFDDLEFDLYKFEIGMFDRDIRIFIKENTTANSK